MQLLQERKAQYLLQIKLQYSFPLVMYDKIILRNI